jgi:hypothetical protein
MVFGWCYVQRRLGSSRCLDIKSRIQEYKVTDYDDSIEKIKRVQSLGEIESIVRRYPALMPTATGRTALQR